ncbi:hypothetical protein CROQUDRAFT_184966 [Cronartium quercuum f. sp. fusiforme G11]|uniref:Uncharacterized protein n=1 Tax=Cronartium quercuum f. sp. fusiforme G11 TaxID=708437 RepID=A0A9P6T8R0_9BASI|nr:hypothetical protein CROQUDRAFT_184966 [Cronartium quercuum f. sp. fusiforme G11]
MFSGFTDFLTDFFRSIDSSVDLNDTNIMLKRSTKPTRIAPSTVAPTGRSPSPTQRSWPLRSSKCGPPKPGWTANEYEEPQPVKVTSSNMNDYFDEMSCKGRAASSGLSAMKFNISDSKKTGDNRVGSSRTGPTRILEKAFASAGMGGKRGNKTPEVNDKNLKTVRSRRNTVVSDHKADQMKIKGAAGSKGQVKEGKKTAGKIIDLTLDNDGSDSVEDIDCIMNPGPTDAPLNFQVHSEPLIASSEDKAEDPMSLRSRKPAAVDSLRSKRRHNSISNTTPQANIEQNLSHIPADKPSPAKSLKSMQLKRLYIVPEDDKSIALPWPVPHQSAFVHVFDRKVSLRGDKPSCFELDVESAHIKEVHTPDPKEEQTKVILILKSGFWRSCSSFRNQVEKWSCTKRKTSNNNHNDWLRVERH